MTDKLHFSVPCLFGLEALVAQELRRLGLEEIRAENGRVRCLGRPDDIPRLNLNLRCGERVLVELGAFDAPSFDALFQGVEALPWEEYAAALAAGNFDLYYGEVRLPANWDLSALVGTGGSLNYGGWADPQTEQLLAACAAAEDRAAALSDLCAYLQQQAPILPLCFKSSSVLYQTGAVSGLTPTAAEPFYDLPSCQIHQRQP